MSNPLFTIPGDLNVQGEIRSRTLVIPDASVDDAAVSGPVEYTKARHLIAARLNTAAGTAVATETRVVHIVRGAVGSIIAVEVVSATAPTGGDKKYTVDVKVGTQAVAFASILSAVVTIDSAIANRQIVAGAVATPALADGSEVQVVVTASGSTGTNALDACVVVWIAEDPS